MPSSFLTDQEMHAIARNGPSSHEGDMPHRCDGARRALFVLGAALMDGRHWQSAVQIVPTHRVIDEQEHLPQPNR